MLQRRQPRRNLGLREVLRGFFAQLARDAGDLGSIRR